MLLNSDEPYRLSYKRDSTREYYLFVPVIRVDHSCSYKTSKSFCIATIISSVP